MSEKYYLTIDLGTSSLKAIIYDSEFNEVSRAIAETRTIYPKPNWAEQDQNEWWKSTVNAIKVAIGKGKVDPKDFQGIGCCGQCHGPSIVDENCRPLHNCLIWPDLRSIEQADFIKKSTGIAVAPYYTAAKLLWLNENRPEMMEKTHKILLPKDFLRTKLTGVFCTTVGEALFTELYEAKAGSWNKRLLDFIGIPIEKMPEVFPPETVVGEVTKKAAEETGLEEGTPVIAGTCDGSIQPVVLALKPADSILIYLGTAPALLVMCKPEKALYPEMFPDFPFLGGPLSAGGGALLKWFKEQFGLLEEKVAEKTGDSPYRILDEEAKRVEPGSEGLLFFPHMMGERSPHNPLAKGALYGLSLGHKREHLYRALLEGVTFHLRAIWDSAKELDPDIAANKVLVFGGGAKSRLWREIIANTFNFSVYSLSEEETACLNLAILISIGLGKYESVGEALAHMELTLTDEVKPVKAINEVYEKSYSLFREMEAKLFQHKDYTKTHALAH